MRPSRTWLIFALCLGLPVAALSWATWRGLELDRAEAQARIHAAFEENVRLSLWRMDSSLAGLIALENARDVVEYRPLFAPGWPAGHDHPLQHGPSRSSNDEQHAPRSRLDSPIVLLESPLLERTPERILLHFQIDDDGRISSPQVPDDPGLHEVVVEHRGYRDAAQWARDEQLLSHLAATLSYERLASHLPDAADDPPPLMALDTVTLGRSQAAGQQNLHQLYGRDNILGQRQRSVDEYQRRAAYSNLPTKLPQHEPERDQAETERTEPIRFGGMPLSTGGEQEVLLMNALHLLPLDGSDHGGHGGDDDKRRYSPAAIRKGSMQAIWAAAGQGPADASPADGTGHGDSRPDEWSGGLLLLARRVAIGEQRLIQGAVLDWPLLQTRLTGTIEDLLPEARLIPVGRGQAAAMGDDNSARRMAALPVALDPGEPPRVDPWEWTPMKAALALAWAGVLLASGAVTLLLRGTLALSERRAAFVSAVTHELRTPLTTFRMYTEMLSDGMVDNPEQRQAYLKTLGSESDRLSHLVENVLAYAQLERGTARKRIEMLTVDALLGRIHPRLQRRLEQAGLVLVYEPADAIIGREIETDLTAVEQVLFNLVDNATKYAASASDRRVHLVAEAAPNHLLLTVRDHGPGIDQSHQPRLFKPFSKSARDAADHAPGVGLGLALSRRLAHQLGGHLRLIATTEPGASFELTLPWRNTR